MPSDLVSLLPQILLAAAGLAVFCLGAFWRGRPRHLLFVVALAGAASAWGAAWVPSGAPFSLNHLIDPGGAGRYFTLISCTIAVLTLLFLRQYADRRGFAGDEVFGLLLLAALGMTLVGSATHWLILILGLELLSVALYVLLAADRRAPQSAEAGLKYFVMGAVASAFLVFGVAVLYGFTGTLEIAGTVSGQGGEGVLLGLALVLTGIGFKVSAVPFHLWTADVYEGAPAPVTAFLSTGSKAALFGVLLRMSADMGDSLWAYWGPALWALATLTATVGNVTALAQTRLKRLLAYSSIAQMGYLLMALLAVRQGGEAAVLFYLAVYAVMDLGAFGIVGTFSDTGADRADLEDCRGLGASRPWRAAVLAACLLALAGLPPTGGFVGKFIVFRAVVGAGYPILALIGLGTALVSVFYYVRVVVAMYMRGAKEGSSLPGMDPLTSAAAAGVVLLVLWLGIFPASLLEFVSRAALSLR
jgi:NADH-quinone oxidoreductase subunit N